MSWERHGECNQCGDCCRFVAREALVRDPSRVSDPAFYEARGFQRMTLGEKKVLVLLANLVAPCQYLVDGNQCGVYEDRPRTCRDFPQVPLDIVGTRCSYWFSKDGVNVGGSGSPYPADPMVLVRAESQ